MNAFLAVRKAAALTLLLVFASCSSGNADQGDPPIGSFLVLGSQPESGGRLHLNDPINFDFTAPVALDTADLGSISFTALNLAGTPVAEQPSGRFELVARPGDAEVGRRLRFVPTLPSDGSFSDGGFKPGRTYIVQLVGGDRHADSTLRDRRGNGLENPQSFRFVTADGSTPAQLFANRKAGGPRRVSLILDPPAEADGVPLNKLSTRPLEIRLQFDEALNPAIGNVPAQGGADPLLRIGAGQDRIFLRYAEGLRQVRIPADVELENDNAGATVVLRPIGVLPNNASIEVVALETLEDIAGESNTGLSGYDQVFGRFRTQARYEPQFDSLVEAFATAATVDTEAPFLEPSAEVGNGFLRAGFAFEGSSTELDYDPDTQVTLNTDFTQIQPANGVPLTVAGGVFSFRNVLIRDGITVQGQGTQPMVWLVRGSMTVNGTLSVNGANGQRVDTLNSANFPAAGGVGVCGGGGGGDGSPLTARRSQRGQPGFGPGGVPGGGGSGGRLGCITCAIGSGGGGGSMATQGDPYYKVLRGEGTSFQQVDGIGGAGCATGTNTPRGLEGGAAGPRVFTDPHPDNDFWGEGVSQAPPARRIRGELRRPIGGSGGGGGGDHALTCGDDPQFISDNKGGGGGGGAGVLIIKALGRITVGPNGFLKANGGNGGGGEQAGSSNQGGGGGGGSGGMVVLMSAAGIDIHAKKTRVGAENLFTYAQNEYRFSVSADGGICLISDFNGQSVPQKYSRLGTSGPVVSGAEYDFRPRGGFGGLGLVQLMAPPGDNSDGTNTALDDNIRFFADRGAGPELTQGAEKQALIAWRGIPNLSGAPVDDRGNPVLIGRDEGDIRPTPVLLPVPYGAVTRVRSRWIDLGAAVRRSISGPDGQPRGVIDPTGSERGPSFAFSGLIQDGSVNDGFVDYEMVAGRAMPVQQAMLATPVPILALTSREPFRGVPSHLIRLQRSDLGTIADRYVGYDAELLDASGRVAGRYGILAHTDRELVVAAAGTPLPATAEQLQVRARFFELRTGGVEGLGDTYLAGDQRVPFANVRIGFAFHQNPDPAAVDAERYPATGFAYDLGDPARIEFLRQRGMRYVQWDVVFDATWRGDPLVTNPRAFGPALPRQSLHFLRLPFRF